MKRLALLLVVCTSLLSRSMAGQGPQDVFASLAFLEGNWNAQAQGPGGTAASGSYRFTPELDGHVLARQSRLASCKAPAQFDCEHGDLLYIFPEGPKGTLKAIYFDSEGHVLHYNITTPAPAMAIFATDPALPGPQFRLVYELRSELKTELKSEPKGELMGGTLSGKFQIKPPGQAEWMSYLEWSGAKLP